jgi:hypothetical protein
MGEFIKGAIQSCIAGWMSLKTLGVKTTQFDQWSMFVSKLDPQTRKQIQNVCRVSIPESHLPRGRWLSRFQREVHQTEGRRGYHRQIGIASFADGHMEDPNAPMGVPKASKKVEAKQAAAAPRIQYTPQDSTPGKALNPHWMKVAVKEVQVAKPPEEVSDSNAGDFMPVEANPDDIETQWKFVNIAELMKGKIVRDLLAQEWTYIDKALVTGDRSEAQQMRPQEHANSQQLLPRPWTRSRRATNRHGD